MMLNENIRETLYKIFEPIIIDIERLVSDQIAQARIKRYVEHQSKGQKITVNKATCYTLVRNFE